jgi:hypothetical protein
MMQCQNPEEWKLQNIVSYSGYTVRSLKNHKLLQMVAENTVTPKHGGSKILIGAKSN